MQIDESRKSKEIHREDPDSLFKDFPEFLKKQSEIAELIRSLNYMHDCSGCTFLLGRLRALANAMQDKNEMSSDDIENIVYLQAQIVDQIRHVLEFQDKIICKLKGLVSDLYVDDGDMRDFEPSLERLAALRSLERLFIYDNLGYDDSVSMCDLKTWADIYEIDLKEILKLLGNNESEK